MISYNQEAIGYINTFEKIAGARVKDIVFEDGRLLFLVLPYQRKIALANIGRLKRVLKKEVTIKEFNPDVRKFVANLLYPIKPKSIICEGKLVKIITNNVIEKGRIFGRERSSLKRIQDIVMRFFDCKIVVE